MAQPRSRSRDSQRSLRRKQPLTAFCPALPHSNLSPSSGEVLMLFLTRWFGVTGCDAERDLTREQADIEEITKLSLQMQANAATEQYRPLARGTHAKGVCAQAQFEIFDVAKGRDPALAARLAKGIFSKQNTTTLPINDSPAFLAIIKLLTASNPAAGLWSLSFKDKLRVFRTLALVQVQSHQTIKPYQQLRY